MFLTKTISKSTYLPLAELSVISHCLHQWMQFAQLVIDNLWLHYTSDVLCYTSDVLKNRGIAFTSCECGSCKAVGKQWEIVNYDKCGLGHYNHTDLDHLLLQTWALETWRTANMRVSSPQSIHQTALSNTASISVVWHLL